MLEKVTGFIVSSVDYRETSLILKVFTKEHGLISVIGKGNKKEARLALLAKVSPASKPPTS